MIQQTGGARLLLEALQAIGLAGDGLVKDFDR